MLAAAILMSLVACDRGDKVQTKTFYGCFDTVSTVYDYSGMSEKEFSSLVDRVRSRLEYYDSVFDIYDSTDGMVTLCDVNSMAGKGDVTVSSDIIELLLYCKEMYYLTGGTVNVAAGALLSIWHDYREKANNGSSENALPTDEELALARKHIDIEGLLIDEQACTVELTDPEMSLDVGAIAKGYAVERVARELLADGYTSIVLDVGGNLRILGSKTNGTSWRTGIRNPDTVSDERYVYYVDIKDTSCVTSGGYERYFEVDGKRYHHLIDTSTAMPADNFASVTVICEDSALADALSSALFIMDYESGLSLLNSLNGVRAIWVENNGNVIDSLENAN